MVRGKQLLFSDRFDADQSGSCNKIGQAAELKVLVLEGTPMPFAYIIHLR